MREKILEIINEKRGRFEILLLSLAGDTTPLQDAANTRAVEITYSYSHTRPNGNRAITDLYPYAHRAGVLFVTISSTGGFYSFT